MIKYIEEYLNNDEKTKILDYFNNLNLPKLFRSRINKTEVCSISETFVFNTYFLYLVF